MATSDFPTAEELRARFSYDPETGVVERRAGPRKRVGYMAAGRLIVEFRGMQLSLARVVWVIHYGTEPESSVSFRDGDKTNLRIANLADTVELNAERRVPLTVERARAALDYSPETGALVWKIARKSGAQAGERAEVASNGYWMLTIDGQQHLAHRVAWLIHYGEWPKHAVDHIDGNRVNNAIANLRDIPNRDNVQNRRGAQRNNKVGALGVHYAPGAGARPWRANVHKDGRPIYEYHETLLDAVAAAMRLRREHLPYSKEATDARHRACDSGGDVHLRCAVA